MDNKKYLYVAVALFVVGLAVGRFTLPAKVVIKTETKTVEKIVEVEAKRKSTDETTVIKEVVRPDGTKETVTTIVDKSVIDENRSSVTDKASESKSETTKEYAKNEWQFNVLASSDVLANGVNGSGVKMGAMIQKRFLGPIYLGGYGFLNREVGVSVGLAF